MRCEHCVPKKIKGIYHINGSQSEILCLHANTITIRNLAVLFETHNRIISIRGETNINDEPIGASRIKFATKAEAVTAVKAITSLLNKTSKSKRDIDVVIEECFSLSPGTAPVCIMQQTYTKLSTERAVSMKTMHQAFAKTGLKRRTAPITRPMKEKNAMPTIPPRTINRTFDIDSKDTRTSKCSQDEMRERKTEEKTIEGKKIEEKKIEKKKIEVKKTEAKKTEEKKTSEVKKTEKKKIEVKKTEGKKIEVKKTEEKKTKGSKTLEKNERSIINKTFKIFESKGKAKDTNKLAMLDGKTIKTKNSVPIMSQDVKAKKNLANIKTMAKTDLKKTLNRLASIRIK